MSGGLIQKLEQAEIQRDNYKMKWRISVENENKALRRVAKLEAKIQRLMNFMVNWAG